jgi:hypothetical protein
MTKTLRLLKILGVILLAIPSVTHAQEGYAGMYGTPNPDRSGSFIASNASGSSAFIMNSGAQLCFDSACTYRLALASTDHLNTTGITQFQVGQLNAATLTAVAFSLGLTLTSGVANGSTAVGTIIDTGTALSTSGAKIVSFRNATVEKDSIDKDGSMFFPTSIGPSWGVPGSITAAVVYDGANHINLSVGAGVTANAYANSNTAAPNVLMSNKTNAASAIGTTINTANTFNIAGQQLLQVQNNSTVKFNVDKDGSFGAAFATLQTCAAALEGLLSLDVASGVATAARTRLCLCTSNGSSVYAWQNVVSGTVGTTTTCSP